jgi:hypothetical protein
MGTNHIEEFYKNQHAEYNQQNPSKQVSYEQYMEGRETSRISHQKISDAVQRDNSGSKKPMNIIQSF